MVEGYYLTDEQMNKRILLPKGIEIMTPIAQSVGESVQDLSILYNRLNRAMHANGMSCAILSHHPTAPDFFAAPNYDRHDYWQWALTAMTTYGPDVNISIPTALSCNINIADLNRKVNYYMPAACALSFASPLTEGKLWKKRSQVGKSIRTHRRSIWAPLFYVHEKPALRFEFKGFEMANDLQDYEAYFLISLAVLLDETLTGRASEQTRIYDLGELAFEGLRNEDMQQRAAVVLLSASRIAARLGISDRSLSAFWNRLDTHQVPADGIVETYLKHSSVSEVLRERSAFRDAHATHSLVNINPSTSRVLANGPSIDMSPIERQFAFAPSHALSAV